MLSLGLILSPLSRNPGPCVPPGSSAPAPYNGCQESYQCPSLPGTATNIVVHGRAHPEGYYICCYSALIPHAFGVAAACGLARAPTSPSCATLTCLRPSLSPSTPMAAASASAGPPLPSYLVLGQLCRSSGGGLSFFLFQWMRRCDECGMASVSSSQLPPIARRCELWLPQTPPWSCPFSRGCSPPQPQARAAQCQLHLPRAAVLLHRVICQDPAPPMCGCHVLLLRCVNMLRSSVSHHLPPTMKAALLSLRLSPLTTTGGDR